MAAALLAGCGGDDAGTTAGEPGTLAPATASASPDGGTSPTDAGAPASRPPGASTTLSGTVTRGVEQGCLLLTAGGRTYLLLGATEDLVVGRRATVTGTASPDLRSTCQQGTPFLVR